ncbi:glycoside hydrolase family 113 [Aestuariivivens sediminicola]|uniref:glycoside hydrolase family 113 n=1 Tax=Aestuariivivens sediminicola TaxID=2913560 RepID=UPI001F57BA0E|nr:glycoside hydrolase [Aestuariivivens sediminicola]
MTKAITGCLILLFVSMSSCAPQFSKINGISFVASKHAIDENHVKPVLAIHANYAAIMPFGFLKDLNHPEIQYDSGNQWFGETKSGVSQYIRELKKHGIKVMLKPQIWVWRGKFTGEIKMQDEKDWQLLETTYTNYILDYAALAQDLDVPIFCIGTELETFVNHRPDYWFSLIQKIRSIYDGALTYAANWNEFEQTPFWSALDFIGIDAYFPVSDRKTPTTEEALQGWGRHKPGVEGISSQYNKPILFTEYGYRSVDYTGMAPWKSDRSFNQVNLAAQVNTTSALYEAFWDEPWFAGGFVWKWFTNHDDSGGRTNSMFTPQNKPAEQLIKRHYGLK